MGKWLRELQGRYSYSDNTMNRIKACLNHFFKYLIQKRIIRDSPLQGITFARKKFTRKRVTLSEAELGQILKDAKDYNPLMVYPFLYTLAHTGARLGEIAQLKWEDVDFEFRLIHLHKTKNGDARSLKMPESLSEMLEAMRNRQQGKQEDTVFRNRSGNPVTKSIIKHHIKSFRMKYRHQKKWTCHSLRHLFAYNYLKSGGDMYRLQAILGHKSIQLTVDLYGQLQAVDVENPSPYGF